MLRDRSGRVVVVFDVGFSRKTPSMEIVKTTFKKRPRIIVVATDDGDE